MGEEIEGPDPGFIIIGKIQGLDPDFWRLWIISGVQNMA
jgi:hypothetical protein